MGKKLDSLKKNRFGMDVGWTSVGLIGLAVLAGFFIYFPLTNSDIWWHLSAAKEMIRIKDFLYTDPFAYSLDGPQWIDLHWFFQLFAYILYTSVGLKGILTVKCLLVAVVCFILSGSTPGKTGKLLTAALFALLIFETRHLVLFRPILITLVGIALTYGCLEVFWRTRHVQTLWVLLPVQLIWVNSQGLFILGPVMVGAYLMGGLYHLIHAKIARKAVSGPDNIMYVRTMAALLSALMVVCFVNPYGWRGALFPFKLFGRIDPSVSNIYSLNVSENTPLFSLSGTDERYLWVFVLTMVLLIYALLINYKSIRWAHICLVITFGALAVMAKRNILLFGVIAAPIIGYHLSGYFSTKNDTIFFLGKYRVSVKLLVGTIISIFLLGQFITKVKIVTSLFPKNDYVSPFRYPVEASEYLKANPIPGNSFHSIRYGGYLMWQFYPEKQVSIDGRLIIRTPYFFKEYLGLLDNPQQFPEFVQKYGITHVMLPTAVFYRSMKLVKWLYYSPNWHLVYTDGASVLFYKKQYSAGMSITLADSSIVSRIGKTLEKRYRHDKYIRKEAFMYLENLIAYLENQGP